MSELEVVAEELRWKFLWRGTLMLAYNRGRLTRGDFYKSKPDWYPVLTPSGREVTISSAYRYNHHHSLWIGHGNVNGVNIFHDNNPNRPSLGDILIEHAEVDLGAAAATLDTRNLWQTADGRPLLVERRRFTARPEMHEGRAHALDLTSELIASERTVVLAKETHAYFGFRVSDTIDVEDGGRIVNSNGEENEAGAMGKIARWVDYSGTVAGQAAGISLLHHPNNPPTPFFCRNYGTVLSNLTLHQPVEIPSGESLVQRWRVLIHDGDARTFDPETAYRSWVRDPDGDVRANAIPPGG